MLQFNFSQATNTNAVYPDVLAPVGTTQVLLEFTQSINKNVYPLVIASLVNTVSPINPWLVFQVSGSTVPTASGQYDVNIFTFSPAGTLGTWETQATLWAETAITWAGESIPVKDILLSTDRAFVSGSNEYTITQYLSPTNGGFYYTYNYP